ncbi:MAG: Gx transporter family protein, partial [Candidatus Omnitrophica bacterium]|nr:Gx transporter family protein [Candidatus Omnitrophota bacterium]
MLVSLSCVLQISESLIPHPIPGLRLGLANCMTLIAL